MNPYETVPDLIPTEDPYLARSVHYGRYAPRNDDFKPHDDRWCQSDPESVAYWVDIVRESCTSENSLSLPGSREAFAIGSVIIRVDRVNEDSADADANSNAGAAPDGFAYLNTNESLAARKAADSLNTIGVAVPTIYFCGHVEGNNVTVESRIAGVSLDVAWRYLTAEQVTSFKNQCRHIMLHLAAIGASENGPSYVCHELNTQLPPDTQERERELLFRQSGGNNEKLCFTHNDMVRSNIIVKDDRVVGLIGWRRSGFFGLERAEMVHQQIRNPEPTFICNSGDESLAAWADLYDGISEFPENGMPEQNPDILPPEVKSEPSNISLDKLPLDGHTESPRPTLAQFDGVDTSEDHPTPKKITNLKQEERSRASSSERSSPTNSTRPPTSGKKTASATKKKKAPTKKASTSKRKRTDQDDDSVDSRRSNTPASFRASKTPASKKQSSASSVADSPAPESKRKGAKDATAEEGEEVEEDQENDDDDDCSDPNETFCICRRPDNHTWMIACDGGCEDWFHGKCVHIDSRDADLIDRYICPNCSEKGKGRTTWKPMCRLSDCRKPARVLRKDPSKYCSDEHGREFMRRKTQHFNLDSNPAPRNSTSASQTLRLSKDRSGDKDGINGDIKIENLDGDHHDKFLDELGSRGGVLTAGELKAAITGVSSAKEFRRLGERIVSPPLEEKIEEDIKEGVKTETSSADNKPQGDKKLGLDVDPKDLAYTPDEASKLEKLRKTRNDHLHRKGMLDARSIFLTIIRQRAKHVLERLKQTDPKGGWKDICGFDYRLAWSDEEFDEWRLSPVGKKSLKDGTPDALATSYADQPSSTDADGDVVMDGNAKSTTDDDNHNSFANLSRGVCTKKRCERHKQWVKVQQQDIQFEENVLHEDLTKCEQEAQTVVERAVLRMWAEKDNVLSGA